MRRPFRLRPAATVATVAATLLASGLVASAPAAADPDPSVPTCASESGQTGARITGQTWVANANANFGHVLDLTIDTPSLNIDPKVRLLLPPSWSSNPTRRYPVLFVFHGGSASNASEGTYQVWTDMTTIEQRTKAHEAIVVMPEGLRAGWYSDWVSQASSSWGTPKLETFHTNELIRILERSCRATNVRAVAGNSMGGFGSFSYAGRHPGMFRYAASYSGGLHTLQDVEATGIIKASILGNLANPNALWGDDNTAAGRATWEAHNPFHIAAQVAQTPVYISYGVANASGDGDRVVRETSLAAGEAIENAGGTVTWREFPYNHEWANWEAALADSVDELMTAIGA